MTAISELVTEIAPTGTLRVALNHGNRVLVGRDADGRPRGITVQIAEAIGENIGVDVEFVEFDRAVDVSSSASSGQWDVGFLAVDPKRAETISFSRPYVRIEGCYMAGASCSSQSSEDLVESGARVGSVDGAAYSLALARLKGAEHVVHYHDILAMLNALDEGEVSAVAGIRQPMESEAAVRAGARVLLPPFMEIRQAIALPLGRPQASQFVDQFLAEAARDGRIGDILEANGVSRDCAIIAD